MKAANGAKWWLFIYLDKISKIHICNFILWIMKTMKSMEICCSISGLIVIPTAPEHTHGGRDGSRYANLDVSILNETT